jgi:hypothetical protein
MTGFRRTSSSEQLSTPSQELKPLPEQKEKSHLDTIDRMLMQFKTSEVKDGSSFEGSQMSGKSQTDSLA